MASANVKEPTATDLTSMGDEFSFLDLDNCSGEERSFLLGLIGREEKPTPATAPLSAIDAKVASAPPFHPRKTLQDQSQQQLIPNQHHQQQLYQAQQPPPPGYNPQQQQQIPQQPQYDASNSTVNGGGSHHPYVFINNVTANVNVHHGGSTGSIEDASAAQVHPQALQQPPPTGSVAPPPAVAAITSQPPPPLGVKGVVPQQQPQQPQQIFVPQQQQPPFGYPMVSMGGGGQQPQNPALAAQTLLAATGGLLPNFAQQPHQLMGNKQGAPAASQPQQAMYQAPLGLPVLYYAGVPGVPPAPVSTIQQGGQHQQQQQHIPNVQNNPAAAQMIRPNLPPPPPLLSSVPSSTSTAAAPFVHNSQPPPPHPHPQVQPMPNVVSNANPTAPDSKPHGSDQNVEPAPPPPNPPVLDEPQPHVEETNQQQPISNDEQIPRSPAQAAAPPSPKEQEVKADQEHPEASGKKEDSEAADNNSAKDASASSGASAKSWASLFHKESPMQGAKPMARIQPYNNAAEKGQLEGQDAVTEDGKDSASAQQRRRDRLAAANASPFDVEVAKFLQDYSLNHKSSSIKPRGLNNRSNWCFVNAILQALVACPPFYNLFKALPLAEDEKSAYKSDLNGSTASATNVNNNSMRKILRSIQEFIAEFTPLDNVPKKFREKGKKSEDLPVGQTLEANVVFQMLLSLNSDTFKVQDGRQEDAEEFLTFLLNELNDEMLALMKLMADDEEEEKQDQEEEEDDDDGNEWLEVGRSRNLVTRRVGGASDRIRTPLGHIFQGQMQSCVQHSNGEPTATLQPFFTLQLDIQNDGIKNVVSKLLSIDYFLDQTLMIKNYFQNDALHHNFAVESLDDYVCSKTKKEIEASRSLFLDELPSILILHLKRFIYDENSTAGCQKLLKNIDFPIDLEIPKEVLSPNSRSKYKQKQRSYKLFAVVYHNGKEARFGHYVTDVYHAGGLGWVRCDDNLIKSVREDMVLAHSNNSMPYILFYRRADTMGGPPGDRGSGSAKH